MLLKTKYTQYGIAVLLLLWCACSSTDSPSDVYQNIPVSLPPDGARYDKLSDYHFFTGDIKLQQPNTGVVPYAPASSLFSDYAHKKRFVWMPSGTQAVFNGADNVFEFPVGTMLIKTFYYDHVQPADQTRLVETRLLVRRTEGWKAYTYVWNNDQTEAFIEATDNGLNLPITWTNDHNQSQSVSYHVPSQTECITCHKINPNSTLHGERTTPIGPKPQNLNTAFAYPTGSANQLVTWRQLGLIGSDVPDASQMATTVDWQDASQTLELRARSYLDINCAHCHRQGGHCDYTPQRFNFSNTDAHLRGACLTPVTPVPGYPYVIHAGRSLTSEMIFRVSSTQASEMMPIIGRTVVHQEGVELLKAWIDAMPQTCR